MADEALKSSHLSIRPDWLALQQEDILEPGLPIVDPHHHLWDRADVGRYLLPDLLEDVGAGHSVQATVFAECHAMYRADGDPALRSLGETAFVAGIAAMSASGTYGSCRIAAGIVGNVDLRLGARAREVLERHVAVSGGLFRGIRNGSVWHADPAAHGSMLNPPRGLLQDGAFREGFAALAPLGLSFDAWMYHTQLAELVDLANAFPETTIVLNHVGGPIGIGPYVGHRDAVFADWRAGMRAVAACPNVSVKLGGFGMRLFGFDFQSRPKPPSSQELAEAWTPYALACIEAFGPQRCMFESNFPVDKGTCSYAVLWNAFKRIAEGFSADDKQHLFSGTATRAYRLG